MKSLLHVKQGITQIEAKQYAPTDGSSMVCSTHAACDLPVNAVIDYEMYDIPPLMSNMAIHISDEGEVQCIDGVTMAHFCMQLC